MYVEPNISLTPSRLSIYNSVLNDNGTRFRSVKNIVMPKSNNHNGKVSHRSAMRLKDKVQWLCYLAKKKSVTYPNGTISNNFRVSFITLTLPTTQKHSDLEIKRVFNNFLTTLRKRYNLKHYVWKAELQSNQNIHFHLTSTLFINHHTLRKVWNNAINRLGYVDRYQRKFSNMTYQDYELIFKKNCKKYKKEFDKSDCERSYNDGQKNNWTNPNSTDIKTVFNVENLGAYMAKYLSKKLSKIENSKRLKNFGGNIWHCSRSLSKLTSFTDLRCNNWESLRVLIAQLKSSLTLSFDFCECTYFNFSKLPVRLRNCLRKFLDYYIKSTFKAFDIAY